MEFLAKKTLLVGLTNKGKALQGIIKHVLHEQQIYNRSYDEFGLAYFHVEAIMHNGIWIKLKSRGY